MALLLGILGITAVIILAYLVIIFLRGDKQ